MDQETLEKYRKAGKIARHVLEYGKGLIKEGGSLLDVTKKIEAKIEELGAKPAFPSQMSFNETAAHNYPSVNDETVFEDQLVCLDVGVHVEGYVGDNALTVDLSGKYSDLVKASIEARDSVVKIAQIGTTLSEIGKVVEETIQSYGYQPVRNLSGHGLGHYMVHTKPTIPNYDNKSELELEEGMVFATEPFATTGVGLIHEKGEAQVYSQINRRSIRMGFVKNIFSDIQKYNKLPFAKRWLCEKYPENQVKYALNNLSNIDAIKGYPPLVERSGGMVSQSEHTLYIGEKTEVLTRE